jgi:hypothetical protein
MAATLEQLLARAQSEAGLSDMGMDGWQDGLEQMVRAVGIDLADDPEAAARVDAIMLRCLITRLRIENWYSHHGDGARYPVEGPLIIVGLGRTATTATHYLLSNDPQFRYMRRWERDEPVPPPVLATETSDPRRPSEDVVAGVMHIATIDGPVEDGQVLDYSFHGHPALPLPSYMEWWRQADHGKAVDYQDRVLRLLHSHRPPHYWLLKHPSYPYLLHDLVRVYPDAKFIMTHRDPAAQVPSACSVSIDARRRRIPGWSPRDPAAFGREVLEHNLPALQRAAGARAIIGEDRFIDIAQVDIKHYAVAVAERIYAFAGLTMTPRVRAVMADWASRNAQGSRGEHRYSAEQFGLTTEGIRSAFAEYLETFGKFCFA